MHDNPTHGVGEDNTSIKLAHGKEWVYGDVTILQRKQEEVATKVLEQQAAASGVSHEEKQQVERTLVFDRLSHETMDERLKFDAGEKSKLAFAATVGGKQCSSLQFFPLEDKPMEQRAADTLFTKKIPTMKSVISTFKASRLPIRNVVSEVDCSNRFQQLSEDKEASDDIEFMEDTPPSQKGGSKGGLEHSNAGSSNG
ncbi:hypothetical protein L6452_09255 [Arctium lappa]|uniref:Uncharacterized protein n=1 Tax=Arctium lappa TaxID=4217 RepID=A0ACB9DJH0_ARCLA|nr:hypothetical protein L6452_09255 [Arctium lappa]